VILIDTSAWVEYFRATGSAAAVNVRTLLANGAKDVAICEPVAMEILAGAATTTMENSSDWSMAYRRSRWHQRRIFEQLPRSIVSPAAEAGRSAASTIA
jgi:predicted nucleic acid-binding protein